MAFKNLEVQRAYFREYRTSAEGRAAIERGYANAKTRHTERLAAARVNGCADCGTHEDLNFHHLDPSTKSYDVTQMVNRSAVAFEAELAKCVVVCVTCHKRRHAAMNLSVLRSEEPRGPLVLMPGAVDAEETA